MNESIKSAERALELLEYFVNKGSCGVRVKEVCQDLGYPQSSASILLKRLAYLGYLNYDPTKHKFYVTMRIGFLGLDYFGVAPLSKKLSKHLEMLYGLTGELCFAVQRNGADLQYIAFKQGKCNIYPKPTVGLRRPMTQAATGRAMLASMELTEVCGIVRRNNFDTSSGSWQVDESELLYDLQIIRGVGYAESDPKFTPGLIGFAVPYSVEYDVPYALGIATSMNCDFKKKDFLVDTLLEIRSTVV